MTVTFANIHKDKYDLYGGRPGKGEYFAPLGNPFIVGKDGERGECIELFRNWFPTKDAIEYRRNCIRYIEIDSVLGCFCKPKPCHLDIVAEYMNDLYSKNKIIYVFGSNLAGRHGKGTALIAKEKYGAKYGNGEGPQGNSYAIPTKDANLQTLPLNWIQDSVRFFLEYAYHNRDKIFRVVKIGCGLAGYEENDIAPIFANAPINCVLPVGW